MKPWREIAVPHSDVMRGTFQQAEFAADITAVRTGQAEREYQDAEAFFQRTFITEGMRNLLVSVARRLNGQGGDPVIQLQTAFGGGKTHTMLAVYHLARRSCALENLAGVSPILDQADILDVPRARLAVLDGNALSPGQPWHYGKQPVKTLWGELAWQLGGEEGFALVREADANGTSPGKEVLRTLLERYAPCVVLIDELVVYIRQFAENQRLSGGTYDSNLSFVQALTEAVKLVPNALLLASLPESETEAGSHHSMSALRALEKTFGRLQALWKPVAAEEAFEIVRRRLFEAVTDTAERDAVCRSFADAYIAEGGKVPSETQEARYFQRLVQAYPIHPEFFDRLYEDWTTLDGFQRTRGVLKLMAKVIYRLWKDQNGDLLILPGSLPLYDGDSRNELIYHLPVGWDAVLDRDIDGDRAETTELETRETRFGSVNAARRVARTVFLGSAPSSASTRPGNRGIDRGRILLGCLQPGQSSALFLDALGRLSDRLHYLNASGDKNQDATRFWFDTRANLRREMEDRKRRFHDQQEVKAKIADALRELARGQSFFDSLHVFTPHGDIGDDSLLRLVALPPEKHYAKGEECPAAGAVLDHLRNRGAQPRLRSNRLLFLAADQGVLGRLRDCVRTALAWRSIVEDVKEGRLNIDQLQKNQAEKELGTAENVLPRTVRDCYRWLLCPVVHASTDTQPELEAFPLNTGTGALGGEIERVCTENELVIGAWSPVHLRNLLRELYWKPDRPAIAVEAFWEDSLRYLYLPRLRSRKVLEQAVQAGAASRDFFGTAYGWDGTSFEGFHLEAPVAQVDRDLLLVEPGVAAAVAEKLAKSKPADPQPTGGGETTPSGWQTPVPPPPGTTGVKDDSSPPFEVALPHHFHGAVVIPASAARMRFIQVADEIVSLIVQDPHAQLEVSVEIRAEFPEGAPENLRRALSENAASLGFKTKEWE